MAARIERNARRCVGLRVPLPALTSEGIAAVGGCVLPAAMVYALLTGRTAPLFIGLAVFGAALYLTRARA